MSKNNEINSLTFYRKSNSTIMVMFFELPKGGRLFKTCANLYKLFFG